VLDAVPVLGMEAQTIGMGRMMGIAGLAAAAAAAAAAEGGSHHQGPV